MDIILGAGLSGLICGAVNAKARIYERNPSDFVSHRAVLRFRDDKIARALGLTFRRVTVRKAVWDGDRHEIGPSPRLANLYSLKVRGIITDNSLWNLAPSERFIAPDDLHAILASICDKRVQWNTRVDAEAILRWKESGLSVISTIPIPLLLTELYAGEIIQTAAHPLANLAFNYAQIHVSRYAVPGCDVFQTIYFPDPATNVYRATLTGNLLTIEGSRPLEMGEMADVCEAFGLDDTHVDLQLLNHKQTFGKIAPVPDGPRKALLHTLTTRWGIYSLGRFATWRNILLDDVFDDIAAIRRMIGQSQYDSNIERTKT